jgi:hypothetical protein
MAKKFITIIIVLVIAVAGIYFGSSKFGENKLKAKIEDIETPIIQMPFDSGLGELKLSNFDIGIGLPSNLFNNISVDTDLIKGAIELSIPEIPVNIPSMPSGLTGAPNQENNQGGSATPPADWEPDEAACAGFKAAPSCSFVPEEYRDLCEKCKTRGY